MNEREMFKDFLIEMFRNGNCKVDIKDDKYILELPIYDVEKHCMKKHALRILSSRYSEKVIQEVMESDYIDKIVDEVFSEYWEDGKYDKQLVTEEIIRGLESEIDTRYCFYCGGKIDKDFIIISNSGSGVCSPHKPDIILDLATGKTEIRFCSLECLGLYLKSD